MAEAKMESFGCVAEFKSPESLLEAARKTKEEGYKNFDAYSPFPIHGMGDAMGFHCKKVPYAMLAGGIVGGLSGLALQIWTMAVDYPVNIGSRPFISLPSFVPITFELTILTAAFVGVGTMFIVNGLPQPYHPLFNVKKFEKVSNDGFFLCIESLDPKFEASKTKKFLEGLGAEGVYDVEE